MNLQQKTQVLFLEGRYDQAASLCEQAIETESVSITYYWHLGLAYLLQSQEEEAQATWMLAMTQGTEAEVERWTRELVQILATEAQHQADLMNFQTSWLIRQHIREIDPTFLDNLLHLIQLSIDLGSFTPAIFGDWQVVELLQQSYPATVDLELLLQVLKKVLEFPTAETLAFVEACLSHAYKPEIFVEILVLASLKIAYQAHRPSFAASLAELCLRLAPDNLNALKYLACFYTDDGRHQQAIIAAQQFYSHCPTLPWRVLGNYIILRALLSAASWLEVGALTQRHKSLLRDIIQEQPRNLSWGITGALITSPFFLPYLQDDLQENRWFQNQIAQLFQTNLQASSAAPVQFSCSIQSKKPRPLRIGYIAHTLKRHSVGWLSRWLFYYHDRELFQTTLYVVNQYIGNELFQKWFRERVDFVHSFGIDAQAIATKIKEDQIDILVDLDSITLDVTCQVMALKPAPVQVTWLGWDASGVPAIDYFIADPYVLPENAQEHYQETIWRLPQTYVAVDGFEAAAPTLRRDHLGIPSDAVVYLSAQRGYKRHPDTARLQIRILKEVPNSYFLIKGIADQMAVQQFFSQLAEEEEVDPGQLRFLSREPSEPVHRANLGIADVVLDTYPYNGATTTLETLWMGVPLVTRVGQQFAARNSYAFMMNVGVTEGIAWTDEEYIEWGARLGKDEALRQQVAWRLKASRQTSPLWNAKQFTREMETAYKQMWERYLENNY